MALERGLDAARPGDFGWVSVGLAYLLRLTGSLDQAEAFLEEAQQCFERAGDRRGLAWNLNNRGGVVTSLHGDFKRAEELLLASLALWREIGDAPSEYVGVIVTLGELARAQGDFAMAAKYYRESLAANPNEPWAQHNLGYVLLRQGELDEADASFGHSLTIAREWGNPMLLACALAGMASFAATRDLPERAARLFGAASTLLEQCGGVLDPVDQADWDHHLAAARVQLDAAAWDAAWAEGAAMTDEEAVAYARGEIDPWGEGAEVVETLD